jgi:hypothetical protein
MSPFHRFVYIGTCLLVLPACEYRPEQISSAPDQNPAPEVAVTPAPVMTEPEKYQGDLTRYIIKAQASTVSDPEFPAEYAFDGCSTTRWASAFRDGQWVEGYFDRTVSVNQVAIRWELARAADYSIQLLRKDGTWVDVSRCVGDESLMDTVHFSAAMRTSGIRIFCHRRASPEWGNSIYEITAFGFAEGEMPKEKLKIPQVQLSDWVMRERETAARLLKTAGEDLIKSTTMSDDELMELVARRAFDFFWWETNPTNGLTRDRGRNFASSEDARVCSVAAVGFALSAYVIGAERGWVSKEEASARVRTTLRTFDEGPIRNDHGFFPHFVEYTSAADTAGTEISTIDTALFLAGMITAMEYFDDAEIRERAQRIFERVDWTWSRNGHPHFVSHGVGSNGQFLDARWGSYTEGILIYLIGIGSPSNPLPASSWYAIDRSVGEYEGYSFLCEHGFQSIFRYQYPALWFDFRGKTDQTGLNYFDTVSIATLAMRQYCLRQASLFPYSYGPNLWGLGAADGPGNRYMIYGFPPGNPYSPVDGTVIPYASIGSLPFVPNHVRLALRTMYDDHHELWGKYGFADSFNPTLSFVARDVIGIDQGTILLGIENYRSELIWKLFMKNEWIRAAMKKMKWISHGSSGNPGGPIDLIRSAQWRARPGDGAFASMTLNDSDWKPMLVPERWEYAGEEWTDYNGVGWYRATFELTKNRLQSWLSSGRPIVLTIGAVDDADTTYLNGLVVGQTPSGENVYKQPRSYTIPATLLKEGTNVLAVRVTDVEGMGGIWLPPVRLGVGRSNQ